MENVRLVNKTEKIELKLKPGSSSQRVENFNLKEYKRMLKEEIKRAKSNIVALADKVKENPNGFYRNIKSKRIAWGKIGLLEDKSDSCIREVTGKPMALIRKINQGLLLLVILTFCLVLYNKFHNTPLYEEETAEELGSETPHSPVHTAEKSKGDSVEDLIPIIICAAEDRMGGTIATINSIYSNTKAKVFFYIITLRNSLGHLSKWIESTKLKEIQYKILEFNPIILEGKVRPDSARPELLQPLNFVRFFIPYFIRNHEKVIYLDDDIIIQGDIQELYNTALNPGHAAAFSTDCDLTSTHEMVRSMGMQTTYMGHLDYRKATVRDLGINPTTCSFNVGVFIANVTEWKRQHITKQLEKWMEVNMEENLYSSALGEGVVTPPMLIVFHNKYTVLNPLWHIRHLGWSPDARYSEHFLSEAKLLHWNGRFKPWDYPTAHMEFWEKWYLPDPRGIFRLVRPNN